MTQCVLQLSDTHAVATELNGFGIDPEKRLQKVLETVALELDERAAANDQESDRMLAAIVLTGDITADDDVHAYDRIQRVISAFAADRGHPEIIAIAGNHDSVCNVNSWFPRASEALTLQCVDGTNPNALVEAAVTADDGFGVVSLGLWKVALLDSVIPNEIHGAVHIENMASTLERCGESPTLALIHHPPKHRATHEYFVMENGDEVVEVLEGFRNVRALCSGHLHHPFSERLTTDTMLLGCPSTYVAIEHDDGEYSIDPLDSIGARLLFLNDDGTMSDSLVWCPPPTS